MAVVVPHFAPGGGSPFEGRYSAVGGSPAGIVETAVTDPGAIVAAATTGGTARYLLDLLLPLLGLPLLAPLAALTAAPELLLNLLSDTRTQTSIHFHYTAGALPGLVVAAVLGAARLRRRFAWARAAGGPRRRRLGARRGHPARPAARLAATCPSAPSSAPASTSSRAGRRRPRVRSRLIPADAAVSASNTLGAHLSERRRVFSFPVLGEAEWIAVDRFRGSYRDDDIAPQRFARALARLAGKRPVRGRLRRGRDPRAAASCLRETLCSSVDRRGGRVGAGGRLCRPGGQTTAACARPRRRGWRGTMWFPRP